MNKHLLYIMNFLQQDKNISEEEKNAVIQSLKDADKEFEITNFKLDRTEKVKKTTAILLEETIEELEQKRKAVEAQNRELEIESSLERVRTVAMSMNKPDDMLEVCKTIAFQLQLLGVKEIRNVQTAIFYYGRGIYMNYEFYAKHDKTFVTETDYTNHKVARSFAEQMKKGKGEVHITNLKYKEVKDWLAYQKSTNVFIDTYLENATSLNYYWHSLGPVALGISTYAPLSDEALQLFQRFLKVFDLSYRRYLDIEKAIAQSREAQIEASLERVRAQALGMHNPSDLPEICEVLFAELQTLGFTELRNTMINIFDDDKMSFLNYDYAPYAGKTITTFLYNTHPVIEKQVLQARSAADAFSEGVFAGKDLEEWKAMRRKAGEADDPKADTIEALYYYFYSINTGVIGISTYAAVPEGKRDLLKRFRNVFDFAYRRYIDVAQAEAQAREARIETALERVRAVAMAMKKSDDLLGICEVLYKELGNLGFSGIRNALIDTFEEGKDYFADYDYSDATGGSISYVPYKSHPIVESFIKKLSRTPDSFSELVVDESELNGWKEYRKRNGQPVDPSLNNCTSLYYYMYSIGISSIGISAFRPLVKDKVAVLERFANVFKLAYQRYIDITLAEAQAREAQIELALERVRARTMAMQKSDELAETAYVLFQQFEQLGEDPEQLGIGIFNEPEVTLELWTTINGKIREKAVIVSLEEQIVMRKYYAGWKEEKKTLIIDISGKELEQYNNYRDRLSQGQIKTEPNRLKDRRVISVAYFSKGAVSLATSEPRPPETLQLLERFANVFDLTYTRFLDLKKAEAQSREAQIELALERVRARTMAMQKSEELPDTSLVLFQQLKELGEPAEQLSIGIINEAENIVEVTVTLHGEPLTHVFRHSIDEPRLMNKIYKAWKGQQKMLVVDMQGEELMAYNQYRNKLTGAETFTANQHPGGRRVVHSAFFSKGMLALATNEPRPQESLQLLERFAKVFDGTYTRFLDLQKAEAQAKEAQIEAALEKVRSRTMAMQSSNELQETAAVLFQEFKKLGADDVYQVTIGIYHEAERVIDFRVTSWANNGEQENRSFYLDMSEPIVLRPCVAAWKANKKSLVVDLTGEALEEWISFRNKMSGVTISSQDTAGRRVINIAFFSKGHISISTPVPAPPETIKTLERFAAVFDGTYTRFLDLEKAEAQAREAQIEAALERVRSRTLAMQKSDELAETSAEVFRQLIGLGIEPNRLYIGIVNGDTKDMEMWATDEDGTGVGKKFTFNAADNDSVKKLYDGWNTQVKSVTVDMQGEELENYINYLRQLQIPLTYALTQKRRVQSVAYFDKGFIGMASPDEQSEENIRLLERFSAVFNLTYTRFNDLKIAEAHALQAEQDLIAIKEAKQKAEETLTELQATQKQLIQSEKMASLGELTAGIAHEIQNPLNFVNNFSEVSKELLDEMKEAIEKGDTEEAREIMNDVIQNLEKINHHGKRADGIVKGMLQHSRSTSATKEPTDINKLVDEYLRLAYHGLRAKDKSFNATLKTDFDESIGNINIIPQDMGRVLLNLITNAFYTVQGKASLKDLPSPYQPTVSISTKKLGNSVLISVADNGNGIPQNIIDKIFQPFFTTKPTGQGTGLGLSLAYDIVKAHGGELKVETSEGEGSVFIINLHV